MIFPVFPGRERTSRRQTHGRRRTSLPPVCTVDARTRRKTESLYVYTIAAHLTLSLSLSLSLPLSFCLTVKVRVYVYMDMNYSWKQRWEEIYLDFFFVQRNSNDFTIYARCVFKKKAAAPTAVKHNTPVHQYVETTVKYYHIYIRAVSIYISIEKPVFSFVKINILEISENRRWRQWVIIYIISQYVRCVRC